LLESFLHANYLQSLEIARVNDSVSRRLPTGKLRSCAGNIHGVVQVKVHIRASSDTTHDSASAGTEFIWESYATRGSKRDVKRVNTFLVSVQLCGSSIQIFGWAMIKF